MGSSPVENAQVYLHYFSLSTAILHILSDFQTTKIPMRNNHKSITSTDQKDIRSKTIY
uniref:Ovule protein n=1 Tax=Heterorhabditis bacteriophora TaxID=37862 RepID=A0A1I7X157_HETBA